MTIAAETSSARDGRWTRLTRMLPIAGILAPLASVAIGAMVDVSSAAASPSVTCGVSSGTVTVTVAGGSASDSLVVTTSGGDYVVDFDGSQTCASQTLSDSSNPTLQVKQTPSAATPTTFQPGTNFGIDFEAAAGAPTTFDDTGGPASSTIDASTGQATFGASGTDTFTGISSFIGSASGSTQFVAGAAGASFKGQGSGNVLDLSNAPASSRVNADAGTATLGTVTDTFTGIQSFVGSNAGSTTFVAGPTSESFADKGSAGGDAIDFSNVTTSQATPLVVNLSGNDVNGQLSGTGVVGSTTYTFSTGASNFSSFTGAGSGSTTFLVGSSQDSFKGEGSGNSLDFSSASSPMTIDTSSGQATVATVTDTFSGISSFVGSSSGSTQFVAAAGGASFTGQGSNNSLSLAPATASSTVDVGAGTATIGTGTDTFVDVQSFVGASAGSTTFRPDASTGYAFQGHGTGNTLDLSAAPASSTIDASTGQATFGASGTDTFTGISSFIGSASGSTQFVAGAAGASFKGQGSGNVLDLSNAPASSRVNADAGTATLGTVTDTFTGIQSFVGSNAGSTTFVAGPTSESFADKGSAGGDAIDFSNVTTSQATPLVVNLSGNDVNGQLSGTGVVGSTTYTFSTGASNFSSFTGAGSGSTTFLVGSSQDSFKGEGSGNSLDFSSASSPMTIDTSSGQATVATVTDTFSGISSFVGSSSGSTQFVAAAGGASFTGQGSNNSLSLAPATASSTVDVGAGTATIGTGTDTFVDVQSFVGASAGSTTFRPDASTGYAFQGHGTGNTLDLSAAPASSTIDASTGQATFGASGTDTFTGISSFIGSASGSTEFVAGAGQSETFSDAGTVGGDTLNLTNVVTSSSSPLTMNLTGGAVNGLPASSAKVGMTTYAFSPGDDFSSFVGSGGGNNDVLAGRASGFTFSGPASANTLDLSHATAAVTLVLGQSGPQATGGAGPITLSGTITEVIGSNFGNHLQAGPGTVTLKGGSGVDWLGAGTGADTLDAGSGTTTLVGGSGLDTMTGGKGSDTFIPGTGGGKISDTEGVGTLDFAQAKAAVQVNLGTKYTTQNHIVLPAMLATGGGGKQIALVGLTNLIGSSYGGDVLRLGSHGGTITAGNGGGDQLVGSSSGGSTLRGGAGGDTFTSVGPSDHMYGGAGNDTFFANNGHKDYMNGGGGHNVAHVDCVDVHDKTFLKIQRIYKPRSC